jgi:hypothetical protein
MRRSRHAACRRRCQCRIDAALADEPQLIEALQQWSANLRPLADQDEDFGVSQPIRERVEILGAVVQTVTSWPASFWKQGSVRSVS